MEHDISHEREYSDCELKIQLTYLNQMGILYIVLSRSFLVLLKKSPSFPNWSDPSNSERADAVEAFFVLSNWQLILHFSPFFLSLLTDFVFS